MRLVSESSRGALHDYEVSRLLSVYRGVVSFGGLFGTL